MSSPVALVMPFAAASRRTPSRLADTSTCATSVWTSQPSSCRQNAATTWASSGGIAPDPQDSPHPLLDGPAECAAPECVVSGMDGHDR
jgi:hypothetical protein